MEVSIGRDTLLAIAAVAWSDGTLDAREAEGIRHAARQLELAESERDRIDLALREPVLLDEVETVRMNRLTRLFTYAVGAWISEIDGKVTEHESESLRRLGDRLGLSAIARDRAHNAARRVMATSASGALDLLELRRKLSSTLSQIGDE